MKKHSSVLQFKHSQVAHLTWLTWVNTARLKSHTINSCAFNLQSSSRAVPLICSFGISSNQDTPNGNLSIFKMCCFSFCLHFRPKPQIMAGLTTVLQNYPFTPAPPPVTRQSSPVSTCLHSLHLCFKRRPSLWMSAPKFKDVLNAINM